jgi:septum formation inhibitor MinC
LFKEFFENRKSCGEIVQARVSPHIKLIIEQNQKKEEEMRQTLLEREKKEKKDKENKKESSKESKNKSATEKKHVEAAKAEQVVSNIQEEQEDQAAQKELEDMRIADLIKNLSKIKKENCNLICYGLPDVYLSN